MRVGLLAEYKLEENPTGTVRIQNLINTYSVDISALVVQSRPGLRYMAH